MQKFENSRRKVNRGEEAQKDVNPIRTGGGVGYFLRTGCKSNQIFQIKVLQCVWPVAEITTNSPNPSPQGTILTCEIVDLLS